jgi:hypothetical protein
MQLREMKNIHLAGRTSHLTRDKAPKILQLDQHPRRPSHMCFVDSDLEASSYDSPRLTLYDQVTTGRMQKVSGISRSVDESSILQWPESDDPLNYLEIKLPRQIF